MKSPKFNLKGWSIVEWFKHNYKNLKELIKVIIPALIAIQFITSNPAYITILTLVGKIILDTLEYWYNQQ